MSAEIYLCDIDGTVADLSHRLHFIQREPSDWDGFFAACVDDAPIPEVIKTVQALRNIAGIHFVSGRSDAVRHETERWLEDNDIWYEGLWMRKTGDHRQDHIVKAELLDELLAKQRAIWGEVNILGVFEDRKQVVDMYRARGLRVFHVAEGNF